jgi:MFS family permease
MKRSPIAPLAGKLSDRVGRRPILSLGTFLQGVGIEWLEILASDRVNYSALVPPLILSGVGIFMAMPVASTAALSAVPPADIGKASGVNSTLQRFGSVFAVAVASAVFGAFGKLGAADTFLSGFRPALGVVGALAFLASVTALAVTSGPSLRSDGRRGRRTQEEIGADTPFEGPIFSTKRSISSGTLQPAPPADSASPSPNQPSAGNGGGPKTRSCNHYVA